MSIARRTALGLLAAVSARPATPATSRQVLQRDSQGKASVAFGKTLQTRVIPGGSWQTVSAITLPTGGPYRIEFRDREPLDEILVGDIWVLAGQSNMQGDGLLSAAAAGNELIHSFNPADRWAIARDPLHAGSATGRGAGLAIPFAVEMLQRTKVPVGLLPCALSGTSLAEWQPGSALYASMLRRVEAVGGRVAGMLWYQGEADGKPGPASVYREKFASFVGSVRRDLGNVPFYYVQIGRHVHDPNARVNGPAWNQVQEAQRQCELQLDHVAMAASVDLEMEDGIHLATDALHILGRRLAILATNSASRGPRPVKAIAEDRRIRLILSGVNGRLDESARLAGFTVADASGVITPRIYRTRADGSDLLLFFDGGPTPPAFLWYGHGKDPYCNIRDSENMALPVFGPLPIEKP